MHEGFIVMAVLLVVFMIIKSIADSINDKKKIRAELINKWGKVPENEYNPGKLESIKYYYDANVSDNDIDDITWNDLDMDELYKLINHTESAMGEEVLYKILRKPVSDSEEISHRSDIIKYMYENENDRIDIQQKLYKIGKDNKLSFYEFLSRIDDIRQQKNIGHYINLIALTGCVAGAILNFMPCIFLGIILLFLSVFTYYKRKAEIEAYYYVFGRILKLLYNASYISEREIKVLEKEVGDIRMLIKVFSRFKRYSGIVLKENGGNITDILFDYIRMITHIDLIKFNNMYQTVINHKNELLLLHENIGYIDSMLAIASFRKMMKERGFCEPQFCYNDKKLEFREGFHPFLEKPVYNDFSTQQNILLTGSNASGKSTFLKTVAINAILAQTIITVCAKEYNSSYFKVMTSMALNDNIFSNKSYFIVEILSLKRILDTPVENNILVCIDEVLRGTNTVERIAASSRILKTLAKSNVLCFAATHDIELTNILGKVYNNYHFRERIENDNVIFDYKIHDGASKTKNAIKLLNMLGYDKNIVEEAEKMAKEFEENNVWQGI